MLLTLGSSLLAPSFRVALPLAFLERAGFAVLTWSPRGTGASGGQIGLDSPDYEVRDTSQLVSFGAGRHFCIGAPLARLEANIVLGEALARIRDFDIDPSGVRRTHSINVRGLSALPTKVVLLRHRTC